MNIDFYMPAKIISGKNCVSSNADSLVRMGKKCFIVTGKLSAVKSGALDDVIGVFEKNGIKYEIFNEIEPNPLTSTCKKAGDLAHAFGADYILGIGGGSSLDAAKAVALYSEHQDWNHGDIYNRSVPSQHLPVVLIGTTAGTGSEVTGVSVLTNTDTGLKKSISGADCYADISFCDYSYTMSVSRDVRIATMLDAFSHAVEAYFAPGDNSLVNVFALEAVRLLAEYLKDDKFDLHIDSDFERIYTASLFAGLAINKAGTAFPHTVGYFLTERFNVPHGKACAVFLPAFFDRAKKYCPEKLGTILGVMNCDYDSMISFVKKLSSIEVSFSKKDAENVSQRWINGVKNFDRTPGGFSYKDAEHVLKQLIS